MSFTYVHLSDIHFGQETGSAIIVHDDVKEQLIADAAKLVKSRAEGRASGLIVTGDIAYAGKRDEYRRAGEWLDRLAAATGCAKTDVQVVPGNHDVDRDAISSGCQLMLNEIIAHGEPKLDTFLASAVDREALYNRFAGYRPFAEGYDCPLDRNGGIASDRRVELSPGRTLRFIGLNSALTCSDADQEGKLLLGARQRVLPRTPGEELVVLCHHPLHWLRDSDAARRYVRSRARVFVSGHEHAPSLHVEEIKEGSSLMMLAAGATVPPQANAEYTYTYNLLTFGWDSNSNGLKVTVIPRVWSPEDTEFVADDFRLAGGEQTIILGSPYFRQAGGGGKAEPAAATAPALEKTDESSVAKCGPGNRRGGEAMPDAFPLLLLRFFRDLSPPERISVLVKLNALPEDWRDPLTHLIERRVIDALAKAERLVELEMAMNEIQSDSKSNSDEMPGKES